MTTAVVVQARTGSTRLPGKVRLPLAGAPLLARMIERVRTAKTPFDLVVATTVAPEDDPLVELCKAVDVRCFRGHPTDLLDRHVGAARELHADVVVKIPSDCPLIDPVVIDRVLGFFFEDPSRYDFVSNLHPATYPDGNDVEVMTMEALLAAHSEATLSMEREHTTPFLWERPDRFRIGNVAWETGLDYSMSHRFTIDYEADYRFIAAVYDALYTSERPIFSLRDILDLLQKRPDIMAINAEFAGVNWYRRHLHELTTVTKDQTKVLEEGT